MQMYIVSSRTSCGSCDAQPRVTIQLALHTPLNTEGWSGSVQSVETLVETATQQDTKRHKFFLLHCLHCCRLILAFYAFICHLFVDFFPGEHRRVMIELPDCRRRVSVFHSEASSQQRGSLFTSGNFSGGKISQVCRLVLQGSDRAPEQVFTFPTPSREMCFLFCCLLLFFLFFAIL